MFHISKTLNIPPANTSTTSSSDRDALLPRQLLDCLDLGDKCTSLDFLARHSLLLAIDPQPVEEAQRSAILHARAALLGRNLQLEAQRVKITEALQDAHIESILLKGAGVALRYYGSISQREFSDIDLLIKPEDLNKCLSVCEELGFRRAQSLAPFAEYCERVTQHAYTLQHEAHPCEIDLHWRSVQMQYALPDRTEMIWRRCEHFQHEGVDMVLPSAIDSLAQIAIGGMKDSWTRLISLLDFAKCYVEVDQTTFCEEVEYFSHRGCAAALLSPLALLRPIFSLEVSKRCEALLDDFGLNTPTTNACWEQLQQQYRAASLANPLSDAQIVRSNLAFRNGLPAKARYLLARLFIPHLEDWDSLPPLLHPLLFLTKPCKTTLLGIRSFCETSKESER